MKNSAFIFIVLILSCGNIFADDVTTTTTTVNTLPAATPPPAAVEQPSKSLTYTTSVSTTVNASDEAIVAAIYAKFNQDPALNGTTITATSQNGLVVVSGTVTSQSQADAAEIDAKGIAGVKDVKSEIKVTTNPEKMPPKVSNY